MAVPVAKFAAMPGPDAHLESILDAALQAGHLRDSTVANIRRLLGASDSPFYAAVVAELANAGAWAELNDRFFRTLAFGTGGLRGRTIGKAVKSLHSPESRPATQMRVRICAH